jgi:hypothetical protein
MMLPPLEVMPPTYPERTPNFRQLIPPWNYQIIPPSD